MYFVLSVGALIDPVYTIVGNHIEPRVAGLPWSLVYVLGVITANFLVLFALYRARLIDVGEGED